jgi:DNA-binding NtrC family response regulator/HAMP domain-containing protein
MVRMLLTTLLVAALAGTSSGQNTSDPQGPELVASRFTPVVDGDLADWKAFTGNGFGRDQIFEGADKWKSGKDLSANLLVSWDNNRLYLAGTVRDDQFAGDELAAQRQVDCIEVHVGGDTRDAATRTERSVLRLFPMQAHRPWAWGGGQRAAVGEEPVQQITQLAGLTVVGKQLDATSYQFEAAIPFHHFPNLRPGTTSFGFDLALRDHDLAGGGGGTSMSWSRTDPFFGPRNAVLRLGEPGLLAPTVEPRPLLSGELLVDLPYLLVPLLALVALVLLLRGWARIRGRVRWLRSALVVVGVTTFLVGLWLPSLMTSWRADEQRQQLAARLGNLQAMLPLLEGGSLKSYRGASRDRAVVDLVSGRGITRQRYTTYRSLVDIAPEQFGPPVRSFDGLPVRCYWLPLPEERTESFQFDRELQGNKLFLVVARPFAPSIALTTDPLPPAVLDIELDYGEEKVQQQISLDLPFDDATSLGRDFWEAGIVQLELSGQLRSATLGCAGNPDVRLVGMSLEGAEVGSVEPLSLGKPSRDGVLTDLRGAYPQDAGLELAPGAVAKVTIPEDVESPEKMWLFYRAVYPGLPASNPGSRVAEVVLHFRDGRQKQTHVLEHQVSMFYELAVHNTRDDPPEESAASIALTWVDDTQERHVNVGYPLLELPTDTSVEAIEFKNLADYRMRFRSVVFVNQRAVAPQDPPDSPLVKKGNQRFLSEAALTELDDLVVSIYRTGELSESTLGLEQRVDVQTLPRSVGSAESTETASLLPSGGRRLSLFAPLRGDGWDGAVLAVSATDDQWAASEQSGNRMGLLLCLLSTPFLLVLLSELLAVVTNLRFRLMTVLSVASLAPLGLLSLVLVQVLESGHETELEGSVRATVRSAMAQLEDQKVRVQQSAQQWLRDLATLANEKLEGLPQQPQGQEQGISIASFSDELQALLSGQLPPEWGGGFLRLEWQQPGEGAAAPLVLVSGDDRMVQAEAPARLDPGLFMQWGRLMLGVRAEQVVHGGTLSLTAGRPIDGSLLGALAPGRDLLLTDVRGYPLAASDGRERAQRLVQHAYDPPTMAERERAVATVEETRQPVIVRESGPTGDQVVGAEVLRDLQETPRALLVAAMPDERATLELAIGRIPVRAFFLLVAGSLVVLAAFLSFVVSGRISRPIERLEKGAQALSRGQFDTRVPDDEGGQVGRLTRAFNQMAEDLHGRLRDLQALNRTMGELAAEHDEARAIEVLRRFCANHTAADAVVATMLDDSGTALVVHSDGEVVGERIELGGFAIVSLGGPFCARARGGSLPPPWSDALPQSGSVLGLPIVFAGQTRGVVLLGFDLGHPSPVDLELLTTVVAQAASACERSQLQRLAVQDPVTGAFATDYFRRRVVDEVSLAQHGGHPFALLAFRVSERNRSALRLQRFAHLLGERVADRGVVGHGEGGRFYVALPGVDRSDAELVRQGVAADWREEGRRDGIEAGGAAFGSAVVVFPEEAASAEFLFEAVRAQLAKDPVRDAVEAESDASLLRAGVTAVSAAMRPVYGTLRRVAPTDLPILLEGETGVGKEVLTNLVHRWSRRARGPLVKVHCASLSETLLASELFGHERGAFTGADRRKVGRFEQASGGTLFLDEVGEIPLDVQVALLRALQEGEIDRVGGTEPVQVDVRVIAATNRDMKQMVADGRFREDLYYRLQGMVVVVPPLRDRREELPPLVERFRQEIVADGHAPARELSTGALDELYRQEWPGNIRQLRTTVFRALVLARGAVVRQHDVLAALAGGAAAPELPDAVTVPPAEPVAPGGSAESDPVVEGAAAAEPLAGTAAEPAGPEAPARIPRPAGHPDGADSEVSRNPAVEAKAVEVPRPDATVSDHESGVAESHSEPDPADLSPRLRGLLSLIRERGRCTTQEHMANSGVSHRTALRDLQALVSQGFIERVGVRRGAWYRLSAGVADSASD